MAMYSVSVKSLLSTKGNLDKRKNIKISLDNINTKDIENAVYKRIMKKLDTEPDPTDEPKTVEKKKHKSWLTSAMGTTMLATNIISSSFSMANAYTSTDTALQAKTNYTAVKGMGMIAIGLIPIWGPVLTTILGAIDGFIGDKISNQLQLVYDNSRLKYGMTRYDTGRYSTYVYDYEKNIWKAQDTERVKQNILHQTT